MSIFERLFGARIEAAAEQRVQERLPAAVNTVIGERFSAAVEAAVQERLPAATSGAGDYESQWRRLSGNSNRELPIAAWARQVEVCYWTWKTNPVGSWIIDTFTNFVTGNGYDFSAKNELVKAFIDSFWNDPVNNLDEKLEQKVRELSIFGVQCWPTFKGAQTGRVRTGMIDPAQIQNIFTDPENAELQIGVRVAHLHTGQIKQYKVIIGTDDETVMSETARQMREEYTDGECFLFSINRVSNDPFGTSDIFVIADWLDEYEEFVYTFADKARKQNAYIWDVEVQGADEAACEKIAQQFPTQADGATRVHNEKMKWTAVAPELKALEIEKSGAFIRNHIFGCKNIPSHWYGGAGDVNRSTAKEANDPFLAFVGKRQQMVAAMLKRMIDYAIQSAVDAGYLRGVPEDELFAYEIQVPEATNKDVTAVAAAVQQLTASMTMAATQGWLDQPNAVKLFAFIVEMIGFALDTESILESDQGYRDYKGKGPNGPVKTENAKYAPESGGSA